ncbi:MAG: response regulator [Phycisphaeraceae bacterium]|nr:response regulator [Phycisphaeraceae bacterium]
MNVLLADDSRTMRNIIKGILAKLDFTDIEEAADGLDAFSKALARDPGLILIDRDMPKMDGLAFVRQYRARNGASPIIMFAAESDKHKVIEAIKAGVNNFVVKPFTPEGLSQRIKETIARASAA